MPSVDERVVQMRFENGDFEKNIAQSMDSIERMDKKIDEFGKNTSSIDSISKSVDKISNSFNALGVVGATVVSKLTSSLYDLGTGFLKSVTVGQIGSGFGKYESSLKSVKTIMAATGDSLDDVERVTERLMKYTDETSYDYAQMIQTMSKFTNAGASAELSETILEGISNVGALAGKSANEMTVAYYNWAQAYSSGAMKLKDWYSIVNQGLNTTWFEDEALASAEALGYLARAEDGTYVTTKRLAQEAGGKAGKAIESFNDSLQYGWFTKDVIEDVFQTFADSSQGIGEKAYQAAKEYRTFGDVILTVKDAMSTQMSLGFKSVFGDAEEAVDLWTAVGDKMVEIIVGPMYEINDVLSQWKEDGGRFYLLEALGDLWDSFERIGSSIKNAFQNIFPPNLYNSLFNITLWISDFARKIKLSDEGMQNLSSFFEGIFSVFKAGINIVKKVFSALTGIADIDLSFILDGLGKFGELLSRISSGIENSEVLTGAISFVGKALRGIWSVIKRIVGAISKIPALVQGFLDSHPKIQNAINEISAFFSSLPSKFEKFKNAVNKTFEDIKKGFKEAFPEKDFLSNIRESVKKIPGIISDAFKNSKNAFIDLFGGEKITNFISNLVSSISESFSGKLSIPGIVAVGGVAGLAVLSFKAIKKLVDSISSVLSGGLIGTLFGSELISSVSNSLDSLASSAKNMERAQTATILLSFAKAMLILVAALAALAYLDTKGSLDKPIGELMGLMFAITIMTGILSKSLYKSGILSSAKSNPFTNIKDFFQGIATSLRDIGLQFLKSKLGLTSNPFENIVTLMKGLADTVLELSLAVAVIAAASKYLDNGKGNVAGAFVGVVVLIGLVGGMAVWLLKSISKISAKKPLAVSSALLGLAAVIFSIAGALIAIAFAVKILAGVPVNLGPATASLAVMTAIIGGILIALVALSGLTKSNKFRVNKNTTKLLLAFAVAFIAIVAGLYVISSALSTLAALPSSNLGNATASLLSIVVVISLVLGAITYLATSTKGAGPKKVLNAVYLLLAFGGAFLLMSAGLYLISLAMASIGSIPSAALGQATAVILSIIIIISILGGALIALTMFTKGIGSAKVGNSVKMLLSFSVLFIAIGAAIYLIAQSISTLANIPDPSKATGPMLGILGVLIVMVGVVALLAVISKMSGLQPGSMLAIAGMMVMLGVTVMLLAKSVQMLSSIGGEDVGGLIWSLVGPLIALAVIVAVLGKFAPEATAIGGAIALIGVGCLLAAVGVLIFVVAFGLMAAILAAVVFAVVAFSDKLAAAGPNIGAALETIAQIVTKGVELIMSAIINGLGNSIMSNVGTLALTFFYAGYSIISGLIVGIVAGLVAGIAELAHVLPSLWNSIIHGEGSLEENANKIAEDFTGKMLNTASGKNEESSESLGAGMASDNSPQKAAEKQANGIDAIFSAMPQSAFGDGANISLGVAGGMLSESGAVESAAGRLANIIQGTFTNSMGIQSPSRVMRKYGRYTGEGVVLGVKDELPEIEDTTNRAVRVMSSTVQNGASKLTDDTPQLSFLPFSEPSAPPEVASSISDLVSELNNRYGSQNTVEYDPNYMIHRFTGENAAEETAKYIDHLSWEPDDITRLPRGGGRRGGSKGPTYTKFDDQGGSYSFVQNNYSPKSLSRIQIYRQTQNQFNNWKGGSSYSYDQTN